eukprot:NP_001300373.1 Prion-like-(Q/N-rich)-domain-bearing protein [Caenorhabditis elegans]
MCTFSESMELLNQPTSTPNQHPHHSSNGADMNSIGSYMNHLQQPSQMSGPHQRPSNGSNNLEQHAMRPATTGGDPSNRVFNDQKSSIDGSLHQGSNSNQMTQESMMSLQQNPMQQHHHQSNQMVSYNLVSEDSSVRLPPLTLNDRSYSISSTVHLSNGLQCQLQQNELTDNTHQSSQVNQCDYNQNMSEQSEQPILRPSRMESTNQSHQNIDSMYHIDQPQQVVFQANLQNRSNRVMQQTPNNSSNHQNHLSLKQPHLSMNSTQLQSGFQTGNRMMPSFQVNPTTQDQVPHLSHMDQPPPTQHSMNSISQSQQHPSQLSQLSCNSNQMSVQNHVLSPSSTNSNMSLNMRSNSISSSSSSPIKNSILPSTSPCTIPMNANSTTQLLMALNNNSPITSEQLQEIQNMTTISADGTEILLMQEPRLKQYPSIAEMCTTDLRSACKKRSLPHTGPKPRLCERLRGHENEVLEERNRQNMKEYTDRHQMYEAQAATLKAYQAKKALLQVQSPDMGTSNVYGARSNSSQCISSNENSMSSTSVEGPPAKKKRISKPKKALQSRLEKQTTITVAPQNSLTIPADSCNQGSTTTNAIRTLVNNTNLMGGSNTQNGNTMVNGQSSQNSSSNFFGDMNQTGTGFFMKDNSCFSHLGSGCRLISASSNDDSQNTFGGTGRAFQAAVPPPPENSQLQFQNFGMTETIPQQSNEHVSQQQQQIAQSRPMNLNQQQVIETPVNQSISNIFNISTANTMQQQQQQNVQQQPQQQPNFINSSMAQNGLQASPCVADQAGPSPSMPVSDPIATTSGSPVVVSAVAESTSESAELMDLETMQNLLSPATLRAREDLLTQQQAKINELVKLIQKNHDTLREQQQQINLAKKQQKQRQRQNVPSAPLDKHVNSRCIQHAIKSRQNFQMINELTTQQDSIRTAETRLIEQLHINTATDDIARLIKQDGRTALVIVSLLHDYRTTREQNNRAKSTTGEQPVVADSTAVEVTKKKAPARKRNANGTTKTAPSKKTAQQKQAVDNDVIQIISSTNEQKIPVEQSQQQNQQQNSQKQFLEFHHPHVPQRVSSQSDVDMEAIFKTVIDASRSQQKESQTKQQQQPQQQQYDNEVISLPSEVSSPMRTQSQNSVQSVFSDGSYSRNMAFQQENSPQEITYSMSNGAESNTSQQNESPLQNSQHSEVVSKQSDIVEILPQFDQNVMNHDVNQFHSNMIYNEDSNQEFIAQNSQTHDLDFDFPDIDQMVANIRDSDPLSCPLDDIDLTAILNSWTETSDPKQQHTSADMNMCDDLVYDGSQMINQDMNWNDYDPQSNIINQAFEQSQIN